MISNSHPQRMLMEFIVDREYPEECDIEYIHVLRRIIQSKIDDLNDILDLHAMNPSGHPDYSEVERYILPGIEAIEFALERKELSYREKSVILLTELILADCDRFDFNELDEEDTLDPDTIEVCEFNRRCAEVTADTLADSNLSSEIMKLKIGYKHSLEY